MARRQRTDIKKWQRIAVYSFFKRQSCRKNSADRLYIRKYSAGNESAACTQYNSSQYKEPDHAQLSVGERDICIKRFCLFVTCQSSERGSACVWSYTRRCRLLVAYKLFGIQYRRGCRYTCRDAFMRSGKSGKDQKIKIEI